MKLESHALYTSPARLQRVCGLSTSTPSPSPLHSLFSPSLIQSTNSHGCILRCPSLHARNAAVVRPCYITSCIDRGRKVGGTIRTQSKPPARDTDHRALSGLYGVTTCAEARGRRARQWGRGGGRGAGQATSGAKRGPFFFLSVFLLASVPILRGVKRDYSSSE